MRIDRWLALPAIAVGLVIAHGAWLWPWMLDDAFIYMRYAENFTAGHGFVFNPGEVCDGYSSFLWIAILALADACGADLVVFARAVGAACVIGSIVLVYNGHRWLRDLDRPAAARASLFLGSFAAFSPWAIAGMETAFFGLLLTLFLFETLFLRRRGGERGMFRLGLLAALCAMTRPEGFMIAGIVGLDALLRGLRAGRNVVWVRYLLGFALLFGPYYAWRFTYYGHPLPNTFYAKVGFTGDQLFRGLEYLVEYLVPAALLVTPILLAVSTGAWRKRHPHLRWALAPLVAFALYVVYVGGDFMPAFRFFVPVAPLLCVVALLAWRASVPPRAFAAICWLVPAYGIAGGWLSPKIDEFARNDEVAEVCKAVGLWFRDNSPEDAVIAVNAAGAIPYYSRRRAIDMLGLNDVHIAHRSVPEIGLGWPGHEKGDGRYVLERRPDYILFGTFGEVRKPRYLSGKELLALPEFQKLYRFDAYPIAPNTRTPVHAFGVWVLR